MDFDLGLVQPSTDSSLAPPTSFEADYDPSEFSMCYQTHFPLVPEGDIHAMT
jgi:hypothetical protein